MFTFSLLADDRLVEEHKDDIIRHYYDEFKATLKRINFRGHVPTMLELNLGLLQSCPLELMYALFMIPPRLFNWREIDIDEMMELGENAHKEFAKRVHDKPEYREYLLKTLKSIELKGALDV